MTEQNLGRESDAIAAAAKICRGSQASGSGSIHEAGHKFKRACAFDFPLDAISRGGRPAVTADDAEPPRETETDTMEAQQPLDTGMDAESTDVGWTETWGGDGTGESVAADTAALLGEGAEDGNQSALDAELRHEVADVIETLEALQSSLE